MASSTVSISKKPTAKVGSVTLERSGNTITAKWKVPNAATDKTNAARWTKIHVWWTYKYDGVVNKTWASDRSGTKGSEYKGVSATSDAFSWTRSNWFPKKQKYLKSATFHAQAVNNVGGTNKGKGPEVTKTYTFAAPAKPTLSMSFDKTTGQVATTAKSKNVDTAHERYSTKLYASAIYKIQDLVSAGVKKLSTTDGEWESTAEEFTRKLDIPISGMLLVGRAIKVSAKGYAQGLRGMSGEASANCYIVHPSTPAIDKIELKYATKGVLSTAYVVVGIKSVGGVKYDGRWHYPTTIKLQRLRNSTAPTADVAAASGGWDDVGYAEDAVKCKGLEDGYSDAVPQDDGKHTWYRVLVERDGYPVLSVPVEAACLYKAKPVVDTGSVSVTAKSNAAGTGIAVTLKRTNPPTGGGYEISWSDDINAWGSVPGPSTTSADTTAATVSVTITQDITPGTEYYVRARNYYYDSAGNAAYGGYTEISKVTPRASTGTATIQSAEVMADAKGAKLVIAKTQADDSVEITYADFAEAWESNESNLGTDTIDPGSLSVTRYIRGLEAGNTYYFRARAFDTGNAGTMSQPISLAIDSSAALAGSASITSATSGDDGETIEVVLAKTDSADDIELSWSTFENAWSASKQPETMDVTWGEGLAATAYARGLEEGVPVFLRARAKNGDAYSGYCSPATCIPYSIPDNVSISAPNSVALGDELEVTWTYESESTQKAWQVVADGVVIANGDDMRGACVLDSATVEALGAGAHTLAARVSTGSAWAESETVNLLVAQAPTCSASGGAVTAQPMTVRVTTSVDTPTIAIAVNADGITGDDVRDAQPEGMPIWSGSFQGAATIAADDSDPALYALTEDEKTVLGKTYYTLSGGTYSPVEEEYELTSDAAVDPDKTYYAYVGDVYSVVEEPVDADIGTYYELTAPNDAGLSGYYEYSGEYVAEIELPDGLDLRDTASYTVRATVTDEASGLASETASATRSIDWAHQAQAPTGSVSPNPATLSASVTVQAPECDFAPTGDAAIAEGKTYYTVEYEYTPTADLEILDGKTYYELDGGEYVEVDEPDVAEISTYYDREAEFSPVESPSVEDISAYYERSDAGDVFDLYRMTADGAYLIASGRQFGSTVTDAYAPFSKGGGELFYRAVTRTPDGDTEYTDSLAYSLSCNRLRLDWDGKTVELRYNRTASDAFAKRYEPDEHLDGSKSGGWLPGYTRSASYANSLVRGESADAERLLREMGEYAGPVFVRTPEGCAYPANVTLSELGYSYASGAVEVSIDAEECGLTAEYTAEVS